MNNQVLLLIHRVSEWDVRRRIEQAHGWSRISHVALQKCPELRVRPVVGLFDKTQVTLPLPHGKTYVLSYCPDPYRPFWSCRYDGRWEPRFAGDVYVSRLSWRVFFHQNIAGSIIESQHLHVRSLVANSVNSIEYVFLPFDDETNRFGMWAKYDTDAHHTTVEYPSDFKTKRFILYL